MSCSAVKESPKQCGDGPLSEHRELPHWKWEYNPEKAKQLLAEAGYPDGFELDIVPSIRGGPAETEICEAIADMWADIGITAHLSKLPFSAVIDGQVARTNQYLDCHSAFPFIEPASLWIFMFDPTAGWSAGVDHPYITPRLYEVLEEFDSEKRWKIQTEASRLDLGTVAGYRVIHHQHRISPGPQD